MKPPIDSLRAIAYFIEDERERSSWLLTLRQIATLPECDPDLPGGLGGVREGRR